MFLSAPIHLFVPFLNFVNINRDNPEVNQPSYTKGSNCRSNLTCGYASSSVVVLKKITQKLKIWRKKKKQN